MPSQSIKESKSQLNLFLYLSLILSIFFLFQIRYTLSPNLKDWGATQYTLVILLACFLLICLIKYISFTSEIKQSRKADQRQAELLHRQKTSIKQQIAQMNPYDFGELVADLFRSKGYKRIFLTPRMNQHFYDIEMYLDEEKVLISCLLNPLNHCIPQAYLDRLYLLMRNNQIDHGIFVTLGEFSSECYDFIQEKPIQIINGEELVNALLN